MRTIMWTTHRWWIYVLGSTLCGAGKTKSRNWPNYWKNRGETEKNNAVKVRGKQIVCNAPMTETRPVLIRGATPRAYAIRGSNLPAQHWVGYRCAGIGSGQNDDIAICPCIQSIKPFSKQFSVILILPYNMLLKRLPSRWRKMIKRHCRCLLQLGQRSL